MTHRLSAVALLLLACADPQPEEKCEVLMDAMCANAVDHCLAGSGLDLDDCRAELAAAGIDCEDAIDVTDQYDECLEVYEEANDDGACIEPEEAPAVCVGVVVSFED